MLKTLQNLQFKAISMPTLMAYFPILIVRAHTYTYTHMNISFYLGATNFDILLNLIINNDMNRQHFSKGQNVHIYTFQFLKKDNGLPIIHLFAYIYIIGLIFIHAICTYTTNMCAFRLVVCAFDHDQVVIITALFM